MNSMPRRTGPVPPDAHLVEILSDVTFVAEGRLLGTDLHVLLVFMILNAWKSTNAVAIPYIYQDRPCELQLTVMRLVSPDAPTLADLLRPVIRTDHDIPVHLVRIRYRPSTGTRFFDYTIAEEIASSCQDVMGQLLYRTIHPKAKADLLEPGSPEALTILKATMTDLTEKMTQVQNGRHHLFWSDTPSDDTVDLARIVASAVMPGLRSKAVLTPDNAPLRLGRSRLCIDATLTIKEVLDAHDLQDSPHLWVAQKH